MAPTSNSYVGCGIVRYIVLVPLLDDVRNSKQKDVYGVSRQLKELPR
jgi:hypothetical protein